MRREERQHLKANPLARVVGQWQDAIRLRSGRVIALLVAAVVVLLGIGGYGLWDNRANDLAGAALAEALEILRSEVVEPPTAETATDVEWVQPEGTFVSQTEKFENALPRLTEITDLYGGSIASVTAQYQAASILILLERYDEASQIFEEESVSSSTTAPPEAILMRLAYAYELAGQKDLALATYNRVVDEFPLSVYSRDAAAKLETLEMV